MVIKVKAWKTKETKTPDYENSYSVEGAINSLIHLINKMYKIVKYEVSE